MQHTKARSLQANLEALKDLKVQIGRIDVSNGSGSKIVKNFGTKGEFLQLFSCAGVWNSSISKKLQPDCPGPYIPLPSCLQIPPMFTHSLPTPLISWPIHPPIHTSVQSNSHLANHVSNPNLAGCRSCVGARRVPDCGDSMTLIR